MQPIFRALGYLFKGVGRYAKILPYGITGIFLVTNALIIWSKQSFPAAFSYLSKSILASELVINEKVSLAVQNAATYNLWDFLAILIAMYTFYVLVMFFTKLQVGWGGAQARWGAITISVLIVFIISVASIKVIDGVWGFVPIRDSIIYLFQNINPVLSNIF